ncbi:hypothetical protein EKK58_03565 [Candidatus Dependentiae bacterium]|nr:MAG: hypothetical protein EKK58_03565 [Candidatus Dependentiae bacterium]
MRNQVALLLFCASSCSLNFSMNYFNIKNMVFNIEKSEFFAYPKKNQAIIFCIVAFISYQLTEKYLKYKKEQILIKECLANILMECHKLQLINILREKHELQLINILIGYQIKKLNKYKELKKQFKTLPQDLIRKLGNCFMIKEYKSLLLLEPYYYKMSLPKIVIEGLLYPVNLGTNFLVNQTYSDEDELIWLAPKKGGYCLFDTQFWISKNNNTIRVSQDSKDTNHFITCQFSKNVIIPKYSNLDGHDFKKSFIVDGANTKSNQVVVIGVSSANATDTASEIFLTTLVDDVFDELELIINQQEYTVNPLICLNGLLCSLMVHPTSNGNTIAYCFKENRMKEDVPQKYNLHIAQCLSGTIIDYYTPIDFGIKKISFWGGNTYLFLTADGQLGTCWPSITSEGENTMEYVLKKQKATFIDFTQDTAHKTLKGFYPHWAFLTEEGEIFFCNFLSGLKQTTLFYFTQVEKPRQNEKLDKVYYNYGQCGVLYALKNSFQIDAPCTRLVIHADMRMSINMQN